MPVEEHTGILYTPAGIVPLTFTNVADDAFPFNAPLNVVAVRVDVEGLYVRGPVALSTYNASLDEVAFANGIKYGPLVLSFVNATFDAVVAVNELPEQAEAVVAVVAFPSQIMFGDPGAELFLIVLVDGLYNI